MQHRPVMLPIPGTSQRTHLDSNVAAGAIRLTDADMAALETCAKPDKQ